ncbi:MAG: cob(I)yrinic acid a,c-diamide adenosyltransferase, partial [Candidatus Omnitrophota bacterium]
MKRRGHIHLYIGNGKGKTTAALGLLLRAHGAKRKTCLVQFLKAMPSSELSALKKLKVKVVAFKERHPLFYKSASIKRLKEQILKDIRKAEDIVKDKSYDLIVLDEVLYLLNYKLIKERELLKLIDLKPAQTELILTGGSAAKSVLRIADYVSTIKETKHPFKKG